jgi:two-component system response regulator
MSTDCLVHRPAEVLLVEDDLADAELTREGFTATGLKVNVHHVENGVQCMEFLRKQGKYADAPVPDLILLDLNMPLMDGREVLSEIANDRCLRRLPVVILTTSRAPTDVLRMYELRCSSYIVKPVDFEDFQRTIQTICDYWFKVVELPPKE